jgi:hypothetical protein
VLRVTPPPPTFSLSPTFSAPQGDFLGVIYLRLASSS